MNEHDLIVVGAGPGGYVAAIRAAQLGLQVACVDEHAQLGGTCLRVGCIPSKAMLESSHQYEQARFGLADHGVRVGDVSLDLPAMIKRKRKVVSALTRGVQSLFKKNGVTVYQGSARFTPEKRILVTDADGHEQTLQARHTLIATGSQSASLPGLDFNHDRIDTSTDALDYETVPSRLAVIGGGYIGLEMGSVWRRLGSEVTVLEYLDRVLPGMATQLGSQAHKIFKKQGITFRLGARVTGAHEKGEGMEVTVEAGEPVEADRVLVAVGRAPHTEGLGLDRIGVKRDDAGRIRVDEDFATNVDGVYAIGDVIPGPMLAHKAEEEGVACVEKIVTGTGHVNYDVIPAIVYTDPEIASVGRTEEQLQEQEIAYHKGEFPFTANGRARSLNDTTGHVTILADATTDRVRGVQILGPRAGDLIAECAAAMEFGASSEDIARTCHAHPTLSEAVREAAFDVAGRAIHM